MLVLGAGGLSGAGNGLAWAEGAQRGRQTRADEAPVERTRRLTAAQMRQQLARAEHMVEEMRGWLSHGFDVLEKARSDTNLDFARIEQAVMSLKGLVKIAEDALTAMQQFRAEGKPDEFARQFIELKIAYEKARDLDTELKGLESGGVGVYVEGRFVSGHTERSATVGSEVPALDTTSDILDTNVAVSRPPSASQTK